MQALTVNENDAGQRLDRYLAKALPHLPPSLIAKYLRKKRVRVNGAHVKPDTRLNKGDVLSLYINDEQLVPPPEERAFELVAGLPLDVVYEDGNIIIVNKPSGLVVHEDESGSPDTLIARIRARLFQTGEWNPADERTFAPALCNRIDRNTQGLVLAAKNAAALRAADDLIRSRGVKKYYLALVEGVPEPKAGELRGYILKDERAKRVTVLASPAPGAKEALTRYRVSGTDGAFSRVECELVTGRTHQIRAQFAAAGWPLVGDGKYGHAPSGEGQALCAFKLAFADVPEGSCLEYLKGKTFEIEPNLN